MRSRRRCSSSQGLGRSARNIQPQAQQVSKAAGCLTQGQGSAPQVWGRNGAGKRQGSAASAPGRCGAHAVGNGVLWSR